MTTGAPPLLARWVRSDNPHAVALGSVYFERDAQVFAHYNDPANTATAYQYRMLRQSQTPRRQGPSQIGGRSGGRYPSAKGQLIVSGTVSTMLRAFQRSQIAA
jgi:hypothetical protein